MEGLLPEHSPIDTVGRKPRGPEKLVETILRAEYCAFWQPWLNPPTQ